MVTLGGRQPFGDPRACSRIGTLGVSRGFFAGQAASGTHMSGLIGTFQAVLVAASSEYFLATADI